MPSPPMIPGRLLVFMNHKISGFRVTDAVVLAEKAFKVAGYALGLLGIIELEFHFEVDVEALH